MRGPAGGVVAFFNPGLGTSNFDIGIVWLGGLLNGFDPSISAQIGLTNGPTDLRGEGTAINAGVYFGGPSVGGSLGMVDGQVTTAAVNLSIKAVPPTPGATFSIGTQRTCTFGFRDMVSLVKTGASSPLCGP